MAVKGPEEFSLSPPASDINVTLVTPSGAASNTSMSSGQCCGGKVVSPNVVKSSSVTLTSVIVPVSPETTMGDGYGAEGPIVAPMIGAVLQN
jgi:hypothetical protein